jgi:hypothetical protein
LGFDAYPVLAGDETRAIDPRRSPVEVATVLGLGEGCAAGRWPEAVTPTSAELDNWRRRCTAA